LDIWSNCGHIGWRSELWDQILKEDQPWKVWLNLTWGFQKRFLVNLHISDKNQQNVKCLGKAHYICHTFHLKSCFIRSVYYFPYLIYIVTAAFLSFLACLIQRVSWAFDITLCLVIHPSNLKNLFCKSLGWIQPKLDVFFQKLYLMILSVIQHGCCYYIY
jgi:hypothetical protein